MRPNVAALGAVFSIVVVAGIVSRSGRPPATPAAVRAAVAEPVRSAPAVPVVLVADVPTASDSTTLALVLDTSGSMNEAVAGGETKLACAKHVLTEDFLPLLADDVHVTLFRFENRNVVELAPLRRNGGTDAPHWTHRETLMELVDQTRADGGTPIAASLRRSREVLAPLPGRRIVVLVTDGEESFEGKDSVLREVAGLRAANIEAFVVGFNLGDQGTYLRHELGLGRAYFEANGGREALLGAMQSILARIEK